MQRVASRVLRYAAAQAGPLGGIPKRRVLFGREDELKLLAKKRMPWLVGIPGVGKTSLAVEYCHRHADRFAHVLWINARSESAFRLGMQQAAAKLGMPNADSGWLDAFLAKNLEVSSYLLVLDNVPPGVEPAGVPKPTRDDQQVMMVSHNTSIPGAVHLGAVNSDAALLLLEHDTEGLAAIDAPHSQQLAETLVHLPLALKQAAASMRCLQLQPHEYLSQVVSLAKLDPDTPVPKDPDSAVALTGAHAFFMLPDRDARFLASLMSYMTPERVPRQLFHGIRGLRDVDATLALLEDRGLISETVPGAISMHRLTQELLRRGWAYRYPEIRDMALGLVASRARRFDPSDPSSWPGFRPFVPHIETVCAHVQEAAAMAGSGGDGGSSTGSTVRSTSSSSSRSSSPGADQGDGDDAGATRSMTDPRLLDVLATMGKFYLAADNRPDRALGARKDVLAMREADANGEETLEVAEALKRVVNTLAVMGADHAQEAVELSDRRLSIVSRLQPQTEMHLDALEALGSALVAAQQWQDGAARLREAVELTERLDLTRARRQFVTALTQLGVACVKLSQPACALKIFQRVVDLADAAPGLASAADHVRVLVNLGSVHRLLGQPQQAVDVFWTCAKLAEKEFGAEAESTLEALYNLGGAYLDLGQLEQASTVIETAYSGMKRRHGEDHPKVQDMRGFLDSLPTASASAAASSSTPSSSSSTS